MSKGVSTNEAKVIKVARWIGAHSTFRVPKSQWEDANGLWADQQRWFLGFIPWRASNVLYLKLETSGNWVLDVHGRSAFEEAQALARSLAEEFTTHVHVKLVREKLGAPSYGY